MKNLSLSNEYFDITIVSPAFQASQTATHNP
jgi:hypothetical protein